MHYKSTGVFLWVAILFSGPLVFGQDMNQPRVKRERTLEDYQPATLKEISRLHTDSTLLPLRVQATYTGLTRPLSQSAKDFLRNWANRYAGSVEHYTAHYKIEMQFIENGVKYWLAVSAKAPELFQTQMQKGQSVDLYLIRISEAKSDHPSSWLLLLEKFSKSE